MNPSGKILTGLLLTAFELQAFAGGGYVSPVVRDFIAATAGLTAPTAAAIAAQVDNSVSVWKIACPMDAGEWGLKEKFSPGCVRLVLGQDQVSVQVADGTVPIPVGIYAMLRSEDLFSDKPNVQGMVTAICTQPSVTGIALGFEGGDFLPENDPNVKSAWDIPLRNTRIKETIAKLNEICASANRKTKMPVFLKFYLSEGFPNKFLPASDDPCWDDRPTKCKPNSFGMTFVSWTRKTSSGVEAPEFSPVSTDVEYQHLIMKIIASVSNQITSFDNKENAPSNSLKQIVMVHYLGPVFRSAQSKIPEELSPSFPIQEGEDKNPSDLLGFGWTMEGHLSAWKKMAWLMKKYSKDAQGNILPLGKRAWVFDMSLSVPKTVTVNDRIDPQKQIARTYFGMTSEDQEAIVDAIRSQHPAGEDAVLVKTESLVAFFGSDPVKFAFKNYFDEKNYPRFVKYAPYKYIARQGFRHGWEVLADFRGQNKKNGNVIDRRAINMFPFEMLRQNALFRDLLSSSPSIPQMTVWLEFWPPTLAFPDQITDMCPEVPEHNEQLSAFFPDGVDCTDMQNRFEHLNSDLGGFMRLLKSAPPGSSGSGSSL